MGRSRGVPARSTQRLRRPCKESSICGNRGKRSSCSRSIERPAPRFADTSARKSSGVPRSSPGSVSRPAGITVQGAEVDGILGRIQDRYFDVPGAPGRRALDRALRSIVNRRRNDLLALQVPESDLARAVDIMRRFLRVPTTLVRCFPLDEDQTLAPEAAVERMLDNNDASMVTWRVKFETFVDFLTDHCSAAERVDYLEATAVTKTGGIRVDADLVTAGDENGKDTVVTLANVQVATGRTKRDTRSRLMRAFNTPFFPDIFVCSQVMAKGSISSGYCRHVIHHDLAWNPSTIEQRTGRVDRLGCKAEGREPISVYLPYLAGAADERQYRVMTERRAVVSRCDGSGRGCAPDHPRFGRGGPTSREHCRRTELQSGAVGKSVHTCAITQV